MQLYFITGNPGKAKYLADYFHLPVQHLKLDLKEIQSLNLEEVVKDKAERAFQEVKQPVLVEDVSLIFEVIEPLPGPLIKWFLESLKNEGICKLLKHENRKATAEVAFAYADASGIFTFSGKVYGEIANYPRGMAGFGWDPIFIPEGHTKTWAEIDDDEKHLTSMRKIALEKLKLFLEEKQRL